MTASNRLFTNQAQGLSYLILLVALMAVGCADFTPESLKDRIIVVENKDKEFTDTRTNGGADQRADYRADHPTVEASLVEFVLAQGVPEQPLLEAMDYFDRQQDKILNQDYLTLIDFSQISTEPRKFIIDLNSGEVESLLTAHGVGSDPDHTGHVQRFSNISGSRMSSVGFYLTAEPYYGKYGLSMRLDGLDPRNSLARQRAIVVHGAWYVDPEREPLGRSWGCPAVEMPLIESVVHRLKLGSLMYAWHPEHMALPRIQLESTLKSLRAVLPRQLELSH